MMEMIEKKSALIIAPAGRMRDSLRALLKSLPYLTTEVHNGDIEAVERYIENHKPHLILLDATLNSPTLESLLEISRSYWPHTHCIVLAHNVQEQWSARVAGADHVLLTGFSTTTLFNLIDSLLLTEAL